MPTIFFLFFLGHVSTFVTKFVICHLKFSTLTIKKRLRTCHQHFPEIFNYFSALTAEVEPHAHRQASHGLVCLRVLDYLRVESCAPPLSFPRSPRSRRRPPSGRRCPPRPLALGWCHPPPLPQDMPQIQFIAKPFHARGAPPPNPTLVGGIKNPASGYPDSVSSLLGTGSLIGVHAIVVAFLQIRSSQDKIAALSNRQYHRQDPPRHLGPSSPPKILFRGAPRDR